MDWDRLVWEAIKETADEWENDPGDWRAVLDLFDRTAAADRPDLERALLRMIDQDYRNPFSKEPGETPWGAAAGTAMPAGMRPDDLACVEAAVLTCAARGVDGAFFPFQRLLGAPRWHALMPNLHWLHQELWDAQQRLALTRSGRTLGAMLGLAAGDALGVTVQSGPRRPQEQWHREMTGGGPFGWAPGEWTSDTHMALAVAEGIAAAPADPVAAIGHTTRVALEKFRRREDWPQASRATHAVPGACAGGNGALVRTFPVALAYPDRTEVARHAAAIAQMTRPQPESDACFIAYTLAVAALAGGMTGEHAWVEAVQSVPGLPEGLHRLADRTYEALKPSGYVADTLEAAVWCFLHAESAEQALLLAVNLGGDSHVVGAVAGGLAGAAYGGVSLPRRWSMALQGRERLTVAGESLWRTFALLSGGQKPEKP